MAYYAIFSLFPLLIVWVVVGSFFWELPRIEQEILGFARETIPAVEGLLQRSIQRVLELRGTVGTLAVAGFLWSATAVFSALSQHIDLAWGRSQTRGFVGKRMVALSMIGGLMILVVLSSLSATTLDLVRRFSVPSFEIGDALPWSLLAQSMSLLLQFLAFLGLYRWVPSVDVRWREAAWGALAATIGWKVAAWGLAWYLEFGLPRFELIYGSLWTVVMLMLWVYIGSLVVLFGAHLTATVAQRRSPTSVTSDPGVEAAWTKSD
jgi:membrane protein